MGYSIEEIFKSIEYYDEDFQENKVLELIDRENESRDFLVKYIKEFKNNIFKHLNEENYVGHIYAVIILAQFKEKSLCQLFLEILALPGRRVFELFDTIIPEYGGRIIASVYDGNIDNIIKLLNDRKANEYAKAIAVQALKILCMNGDLTKEEVEEFLVSLLETKLKDKKSAVILEILYNAVELDMEKVLKVLKNRCEKGEYSFLSISQAEAELKMYKEGLYTNEGINDIHNQKIINAAEELKKIFEAIEEKNSVKKEAEKLQDTIIKEINTLGKKFQKGIKSKNMDTQLKALSKEELYEIGKQLKLKGYYKLNKDNLIEGILSNYQELIQDKLIYFDEERIQELRMFLKNGGVRKVEKSAQFNTFFYLESYGLIYPFAENESTGFILPDEVYEIIKDAVSGFVFRKSIKKNSEILSLVNGMLEAYGIMEEKDIIKKLRLYDITESEEYIKKVIEEASGLYYSKVDKSCIVNGSIDNFSVIDELQENMTKDDYKLFSREELIAMSNYDWVETVPYAEEFYNSFIEEFIIEKENIVEIINDMKADIQVVEADVITQFMVDSIDNKCSDELDVDELKESKKLVKKLVSEFLESVPLWKYKGRCMREINKK